MDHLYASVWLVLASYRAFDCSWNMGFFLGKIEQKLLTEDRKKIGGGNFLMSGIRVCATDQGRFFTSKNPEQAPNF